MKGCKKKNGEIDVDSKEWLDYCEKYGIASSITFPRIVAAINGFVHKKGFKDTLLEKNLTLAVIKNSEKKLLKEVEKVKEKNADKYDEIKVDIENKTFKVIGIKKKEHKIDGIPANVKYFKCGWTPRKPEDYLLSNALCLHVKELIELQTAREVDGIKTVLILNRADYIKAFESPEIEPQIENVWVNENLIFNAAEMRKLRSKNFRYIPREYFSQELREVGEYV